MARKGPEGVMALTISLSLFLRCSPVRKNKLRLRPSGPPNVATTIRLSRSGVDWANALRASNTEFLANTARLPWNFLRPRCVVTSTLPLPGRRNSAE